MSESPATSEYKRTSLYLPREIITWAKDHQINFSQTFITAIRHKQKNYWREMLAKDWNINKYFEDTHDYNLDWVTDLAIKAWSAPTNYDLSEDDCHKIYYDLRKFGWLGNQQVPVKD